MHLSLCSNISFFFNEEKDLYVSPDINGIKPAGNKASFYRYRSKDVCRQVMSLPDVPAELDKAAFRIGEEENGYFPIITRRLL